MSASETSRGTILAIASGKGGVGKTWLAVTLAHAMARAGRRVLLCDADFGLANIDVQLGLTPGADLAAVLAGHIGLEQAVAMHPGGFAVLPGSSGSGAMAALDPAALGCLLDGWRGLAERYDTVLLDCGAGLDVALRRIAIFADVLLVVLTDEPTSLTDAYAVLKLYASDRRHAQADGSARVVVNQAASLARGRQTHAALARACNAFLGGAPPLAGVIRRDAEVGAAIRRQAPLLDHAPDCAAARDVVELAGDLPRMA